MVYQSECVPLSRILPQLYLGAESDITQDCLSGRGISYVLSVSRCCPQPSFLPQSQYLRVPIDDSLRDDLLPWIPQALTFIDGALSRGCSVVVHCAAGISRSPALAVAYVMYSLEMDLDHAYRFVKERRPTISPNFNFLGQLQLFQGTLSLNSKSNPVTKQPVAEALQPPACAAPSARSGCGTPTQKSDRHHVYKAASAHENENLRPGVHGAKPEFTLSLSDKLRNLTLRVDPREVQEAPRVAPQKPTQLQLPSSLEKRKSLTLSLTPLCSSPQTNPADAAHRGDPEPSAPGSGAERGVPQRLPQSHTDRPVPSSGPNTGREASTRCTKSRSQKRRSSGQASSSFSSSSSSSVSRGPKDEQTKPKRERRKRRTTSQTQSTCVPSPDRQVAPVEAVEAVEAGDPSPLSPVNLTVNRLLGWGERMVLGVLLGPHIKLGQASLPYRC